MYVLTTFLFLFLSNVIFAQPFAFKNMDSTTIASFKKHGLHQMTNTWNEHSGTKFTNIQLFNSQGMCIENLTFSGKSCNRKKETYDRLNRRTSLTFFAEWDTSLVTSLCVYTYPDSLTTKEETFNRKKELTATKLTEYKKSKDTVWVMITETRVDDTLVRKSLERFTEKGDSLTIVEYVDFDDEGKMKDINSYYYLTRKDKNGNRVRTSGRYNVVVDESLRNNPDLYIDVVKDPEKRIQHQLDGKYRYVYGKEIISTDIFDPKGQVISRACYDDKVNFFYNSQGQIIKIEEFRTNYSNRKEQKVREVVYHYDSRNLPLKVVTTSLNDGEIITYLFEFK